MREKAQEDYEESGFWTGPMDWSGGNYDDAYKLGLQDGKIQLARHLLEEMGESYDK